MPRHQINPSIQAKAIHANRDSGSAKSKPLAKLRLRKPLLSRGSVSESSEESILIAILSIGVIRLILITEKCQSLFGWISRPVANFRPAERHNVLGPMTGSAPTALRFLIDDLKLLLFVLLGREIRGLGTECGSIALGHDRAAKRSSRPILKLALFLLSLAPAKLALAQQAEPVAPEKIFQSEEGQGIRVGPGFRLNAEVSALGQYDSNVYSLPVNKRSDIVAIVTPRAALRSDWSRHSLKFEGGAELRRFAKISGENSTQYDVGTEGLLQLGYGIDLRASGNFAHRIEQRGTSGDQFLTDEPVAYDEKRAALSIQRLNYRFGIALEGSVQEFDYQSARANGAILDQSYRDLSIKRAGARGLFRLSDRTRTFVEAGINSVQYEQRLLSSRDSDGYEVLAGVNYELSQLSSVEVAAGYLKQNFDSPAYESFSGLSYRVRASWLPEPSLRVTASGQRKVERSPRLDAPAIIRSDFSLSAEKALGTRILAEARVAYVDEKYRNIIEDDQRYEAHLGMRYRVTDRVGAFVTAGYRHQNSSNPDREYSGFSLAVGTRVLL